MKTIAIFLFSALALTACVADDQDREVGDKAGINQRDPIDLEIDGAAAEWVSEHVIGAPRHGLDGRGGDWAEEIVLGDKIYTLIHRHTGDARLLDALGQLVVVPQADERLLELLRERGVVPACHACDRF